MARTILLVRLSARALFNETTAQMAAGIQPSNVSCNKRQITPVSILPLIKNDNHGSNMAMSVILKIAVFCTNFFFLFCAGQSELQQTCQLY
jgi:hypothetical protein